MSETAKSTFGRKGEIVLAITTIVTGALLILTGIAFYVISGEGSFTALIPSFLGIIIFVLGLLARNEKIRRHAIHAAAAFGLIGILGSLMGLKGWIAMLQGAAVARPIAEIERLVMFVICVAFVGMCIRSFIQARRSKPY